MNHYTFYLSDTLLHVNCALLLLQCWCWQNWMLHCHRHHARYGRARRRRRHLQLRERASIPESEHGADRGIAHLLEYCFARKNTFLAHKDGAL